MNRLALLIGISIYASGIIFAENIFNTQEFPTDVYTKIVQPSVEPTEKFSFTTVSITNIITNSITNITKQASPLENIINQTIIPDQEAIETITEKDTKDSIEESPTFVEEKPQEIENSTSLATQNDSVKKPIDLLDIKKFIDASRSGDLEVMKELIAKGVPVNTRTTSADSNGSTVLMCAVGERRIKGISILLNAGADPNLTASNKNIGSITTLMIAAIVGPLENVLTLIDFGADVNAKTTGTVSGSTALMAAVGAQRLDIVKALVNAGADINAKTGGENITGVTALMLAAETGNEAIINYLLSRPDIKINLEDSEKKSALVYAYISGNTSVVNTLMNAGAKTSLSPQKLKHFVQRSLK